MKRHIILILIENEAGALSYVSGLFSARAYNIESLTVASTEDPSLSRMTIVTTCTDHVMEQISKQLNKLIDVVKLLALTNEPHIEREMRLIKIKFANMAQLKDIKFLTNIYSGNIIDVTSTTITIELISSGDRLDAFIESLAEYKIIEIARSGITGISCGETSLNI